MAPHRRTILYLAATAAIAMPVAAQVEGLDADGDGKITRREYIDARNARFTQLDQDRDGRLTTEDFPRARQSQSLNALAGRLVAHADLNQDGAVTQDELGLAGDAPVRPRRQQWRRLCRPGRGGAPAHHADASLNSSANPDFPRYPN